MKLLLRRIEMNKENRELLNWLEELTKFADYKLSQINNDIKNTDDIKLHTIFTLSFAMNYYVINIKDLLKTNLVLPANILLRSLMEGFINIEYIINEDSELRAAAYVFEDFESRKKNLNNYKNLIIEDPDKSNLIPSLSTPEKCDEKMEELEKEEESLLSILKNKYKIEVEKKDLNFLNLFDRADKANLKNLYKLLYPYLSGWSHMSASGLKDFIKNGGDKYLFNVKDSEDDLKNIIETTYRIYFVSIEDLSKQFNIYLEEEFKNLKKIL